MFKVESPEYTVFIEGKHNLQKYVVNECARLFSIYNQCDGYKPLLCENNKKQQDKRLPFNVEPIVSDSDNNPIDLLELLPFDLYKRYYGKT